ncbi:MAG: nickel-type superoxide dismutase maturation protease [Dehalococcoidia bacterium]
MAALSAAFAAGAARRSARYEVAGRSMLPTLREGDWLLVDKRAYGRTAPRAGDIIVALDPRDATRPIIKRVSRLSEDGALSLLGDNPGSSTDSRHFGLVPAALVRGRVCLRYWPRPRLF